MTVHMEDFDRLQDAVVVDDAGKKIGRVADVYFDEKTRAPEWVVVNTGLFGTKETFVPLARATFDEQSRLRVPYTKGFVQDAPRAEPDIELSKPEEAALYAYYELRSASGRSGPRRREGQTDRRMRRGADNRSDDAMTRSEEELVVDTVRRPSELVRLKKYVVTEPREVTIPLRREKARVQREPITDANIDRAMAGPELTEAEHEVTLSDEEPSVQKRVVPKERVRLDRDVSIDRRTISEDVRHEQIAVERKRKKR